MQTINVTIRLDKETANIIDKLTQYLDELAAYNPSDKSRIFRQAIRKYVEAQQGHLDEIRQAIKEADASDLLFDTKSQSRQSVDEKL